MNIELHIESLILHGFHGADRQGIVEAMQSELERMLASGELSPTLVNSGSIELLKGGVFNLSQGASGAAIGAEVARSVYGCLEKR